MQERRQAERILLNVPVRWKSLLTQGRGTISDLSVLGCFVLAGAEVDAGELIRLQIDFGNDFVFAWARVVYAVPEMGFALQFIFADENEQRAMATLVDKLRRGTVPI